MSFGVGGASGTGKTTLAKDVSAMLNVPYHDASVTKIMQRIGFDPVAAGHDLDSRLTAQEHLLDAFCADLRALPRPFITDRTPIDMAAYMLGELTMRNATEDQGERVALYVERCVRATETLFDSTVYTRPLLSYDVAPTRPPPNVAYQKQIHLLISALLSEAHEERNLTYALITTDHRRHRAKVVTEFLQSRIDYWMQLRENLPVN